MWKAFFLFGFLLVIYCATASLLGGFEDVDVNEHDVVTAANHAIRQLSKNFANKYHHRLVKLLKAKRQVETGPKYKMDIVVGKTKCKKAEVEFDAGQNCDFQDGVNTYKKCQVVVYRAQQGNYKLVSSGCILTSKKDL